MIRRLFVVEAFAAKFAPRRSQHCLDTLASAQVCYTAVIHMPHIAGRGTEGAEHRPEAQRYVHPLYPQFIGHERPEQRAVAPVHGQRGVRRGQTGAGRGRLEQLPYPRRGQVAGREGRCGNGN